MKKITVRYGSEQRDVHVSSGATVGAIIADNSTKIILGYGDNVKALINGVEMSGDTVPSDGDEITIETRANQKAV